MYVCLYLPPSWGSGGESASSFSPGILLNAYEVWTPSRSGGIVIFNKIKSWVIVAAITTLFHHPVPVVLLVFGGLGII